MPRHFCAGRLSIAVTSVMAALAAGCSGGMPNTPSTGQYPLAQAGPLNIKPTGDQVPMGHARVRLDADLGTAEVLEDRVNQAVGDAFLVGLTGLESQRKLFTVTAIDREPTPTGARLTLDVEFTHPFPLASRPDLFGWDLKAIIATDRDSLNVPLIGRAASGFDSASGYTMEWTPQIRAEIPTLAAEVFPYVILGEDPTVVDPFDFHAPAGWNVFPSGGTNAGQMSFELTAGEVIDFDIFFTVGYQASATRATRQSPDYTPPRGNSRAAWKVEGTVSGNSLSTVTGTNAQLDIAIWDWQHGQSLGSDVTEIKVHVPELMSAVLTPAITGGTGRDTDPLTATATIVNNLGSFTGGDTWALIEVVDALHGANPGGGGANQGVFLVEDDLTTIGDLQEIRAFQMVRLPVLSNLPGQDPVAAVTAIPAIVAGSLTISDGTNVQYDASTSTDPDPGATPEGTIVGYEWDYEWDGVIANFVDDTAGAGTVTASHLYPTAGTTHLGLRVEDGVGRKSAILDIPITITDQQIVLNLDPIIDLPLVYFNNRTEIGPALCERSGGAITVSFWEGDYATGFSGRNGCSVYNAGNWGAAFGTISTGGAEHGWVCKSAPDWANNKTHTLAAYTDPVTHEPGGWTAVFGYDEPNTSWAVPTEYRYGYDLATHQTTGQLFVFGDFKTLTEQHLTCRRGGPVWGNPVFNWSFGGPAATIIDARASSVSRSRSAWADIGGAVHLAYRAQDGSQLRYAKDPDSDNLAWNTADLATGAAGEYGDPALDQLNGIVTIAVARFTGGTYQIQLYRSGDNGTTFAAPINVGAPLTDDPKTLSVSTRTLFGQEVITVGYVSGAPSSYRVRWTPDGGSSWQDATLGGGAAPGDYSGDLLQTRASSELFAAWCGYASGRSNIMARRGVFVLQ